MIPNIQLVKCRSSNNDTPDTVSYDSTAKLDAELNAKLKEHIKYVKNELHLVNSKKNADRRRFLQAVLDIFNQVISGIIDDSLSIPKRMTAIILYFLERDGVLYNTRMNEHGKIDIDTTMNYASGAVIYMLNKYDILLNNIIDLNSMHELLIDVLCDDE